MQKVRTALDVLAARSASVHPLASERFETDGIDIFVRELGQLVNLSKPAQQLMREVFEAHVQRIERDGSSLPKRLFPFITNDLHDRKSVMIDPRIAFGRRVLSGTGIPTEVIASRFLAGDSVGELVDDYGIDAGAVQDALRCELHHLRAA